MGLLNNYHVSKHITHIVPVKEIEFAQIVDELKANKKGEYNCFHWGEPNHWA